MGIASSVAETPKKPNVSRLLDIVMIYFIRYDVTKN